jgi:hypothetical protein
VAPWTDGSDPVPSWRGACITLADNDDTEINVVESVYEVRRRIDAAQAATEPPWLEASNRRIAMVIVERVPWRGLGWAVFWWGAVQAARTASLLQDIYYFAFPHVPASLPATTQGLL